MKRYPFLKLASLALLAILLIGATGGITTPADTANDAFWDDRFGLNVISGDVRAVAVAANGDIYIGGAFNSAGGVDAKSIARWDGRRWHALGTGIEGDVYQIAISGNDVYAVGYITSAGGAIARDIAHWDGAAWSAVGNGNGTNDTGSINAIAVSGNHVYIGGDFEEMDGVAVRHVAHWDGATWAALGPGLAEPNFENTELTDFGDVRALWADGPNAVYAGGRFTATAHNGTVVAVNRVARWDGTAWQPLGAGLDGDPADTSVDTLYRDGQDLYAAGAFTQAGGQAASTIARWDGAAWHALGSGITPTTFGYRPVRGMARVGEWLYVGGEFIGAGGQTVTNLARWNGTAWQAAGEPDATVEALGVDAGGHLVAVGGFTWIDDYLLGGAGWLDGDVWRSFGEGVNSSAFGIPGEILAVAVDGAGNVYVGGNFIYAGSIPARNLAMWDGSRWHNIGDADQSVYALAISGNTLYVGGNFSQVGNVNANHVAAWNRPAQTWSALGSGINGPVYALDTEGGILYAGGVFTAAGDSAAYDVAWWDGGAWHPFGNKLRVYEPGAGGGEFPTLVYALDAVGDDVAIGGQFQTLQDVNTGGYVLVNNVVLWNRAEDEWYRVGRQTATEEPGVTNNGATGTFIQANAVAIVGNDVYVGGNFNQAGTVAVSGIARWNYATETWSALGGGVGGFDGAKVNTLLWADGVMLVGGSFLSAGNSAARYIASYNPAGDAWAAFGSGVTPHALQYRTDVFDIARSGNALYVGGDFEFAGGKSSLTFARYAPPEPVWTDFIYLPFVVR